MSFAPDILVTSRDGTSRSLVVEVKLSIHDLQASEQQLKAYMVRHGYATGMLVTPDAVRIYRDTFASYEEGSVELVGAFSTAGVFEAGVASTIRAIEEPGLRGVQFEDEVQRWLEGLTNPSNLAALAPDLREAVEDHVVPALEQGEVRAAGPRASMRRTGT
ncbi:hypothetical protein WMF45_34540 [Sorangium sp. So ce448]|uniref:hypothetical protein n=1 Tax=unclassified Sorangium TaxID=2621164 RepID=UPI003F5BC3EC